MFHPKHVLFSLQKYKKNELQKHHVVDQSDINVFSSLHQVLFLPLLIYFINFPLLYFIFVKYLSNSSRPNLSNYDLYGPSPARSFYTRTRVWRDRKREMVLWKTALCPS